MAAAFVPGNVRSDIATSREANYAAADFIKRKIGQIVKNPEVARKLTPTDIYAKRPLCGNDYYYVFNGSPSTHVDVKKDPSPLSRRRASALRAASNKSLMLSSSLPVSMRSMGTTPRSICVAAAA